MNNILKIFDPISKTWKGVTAIKGDTGKSAYQYAFESGYKGTEAQFKTEQANIANNSERLTTVEENKANLINGYVPSVEIDPLQGKQTGVICLFGHYAGNNQKLAIDNDCSIELIFNMVKLPGRVRCLTSIGDIQISIAVNSTLTVVVGNSTIDNIAIPLGLNHIVVSLGYEDRSAAVYVNGVLSKTQIFNYMTPSSSMSIGNNSTGSATYEGIIHSIRIFNYIIPESNILELFSQRNAFSSGLSQFEKCDDSMEYILNPEAKYVWNGTSAPYYYIVSLNKALPSGFTYRIKYRISNYISGTPFLLVGSTADWNASIPLQSKNGEFSVDIKSRLNFSTSNVLIYGGTIGTDRQFTAEIISIKKIGCIAEYPSFGAQRTKWINTVDRNDLLAVKAPELTYQHPEYATVNNGLRALFVARGAVWNASTGYYELNGLTDITEAQMIEIYNKTSPPMALPSLVELYNRASFRTNFPYSQEFVGADQVGSVDMRAMFYLCVKTETLNIKKILPYRCNAMFTSCYLLKTIFGIIHMSGTTAANSTYMFANCRSLSNVSIYALVDNLSFSDSPLLTRDSILYMITNAANTTPITVTLHAQAKVRLTEADIALASSKNITIA